MGHDHLKTDRVVARALSKPAEGGRDVWNRVRRPGHGDALWPLSPSPDACRLAPRLPRRWPPPCVSSSSSASHLGASEVAASSHGDSLPVSGPGSRGCPAWPLVSFSSEPQPHGTARDLVAHGPAPLAAAEARAAGTRDPHTRCRLPGSWSCGGPRVRAAWAHDESRRAQSLAERTGRDGTGRDGLRKRRCRPPPFPPSACDFTAADETAGHGRCFFFFFFGFI